MDPSDKLKPTVTWEHFYQVTQLNIELLKDNAFLRERATSDNKVIMDLLHQRQELFDMMQASGVAWPAWAGVPNAAE